MNLQPSLTRDWRIGQAVNLCSMLAGVVARIPVTIVEVGPMGILVEDANRAAQWLDDDGSSPKGCLWLEERAK